MEATYSSIPHINDPSIWVNSLLFGLAFIAIGLVGVYFMNRHFKKMLEDEKEKN